MTQPPLDGLPPRAGTRRPGIWSRLKDTDGHIDAAAWRHHHDTLQHVGICGHCGHPLIAGRTYTVGNRTFYEADCTSPSCDYPTAAGGPRPEKAKKGAA